MSNVNTTFSLGVLRHHDRLFAGMPRTIASRAAVVKREKEQNQIEDTLDAIEREIFRMRIQA